MKKLAVLFFLICLALLVRLVNLSNIVYAFWSDDAAYALMARYFFEGDYGKIVHIHWRPFYPFCEAIFYFFVRDWVYSAYAVSLFFGMLLVVPVYLIVEDVTDRVTAFFAGLYVVFLRPLIEASTSSLTEATLSCFVWSGFYFVWKAIKGNRVEFGFWGGVLWGVAYLTKSEGILLVAGLGLYMFLYVVFVVWKEFLFKIFVGRIRLYLLEIAVFVMLLFYKAYVPYNSWVTERVGDLDVLASEGVFAVGVMLILAIYFTAYLIIRSKMVTPIIKRFNGLARVLLFFLIGYLLVLAPFKYAMSKRYGDVSFFAKLYAHLDMSSPMRLNKEGTSTWAQDVWGVETINPKSEIFQYPKRFRPSLLIDVLYTNGVKRTRLIFRKYLFPTFNLWEWCLMGIGLGWLLLKAKDKRFGYSFLVVFGFVYWGIMFLNPSANERYIYNVLPFFVILIFAGIYTLWRNGIFGRRFYYGLLVVFFALYIYKGACYLPVGKLHKGELFRVKRRQVTSADEWFLENDAGKRVMSVHEGAGFYSRSMVVFTPQVWSLEELVDYAELWGVSYIIASREELPPGVMHLYTDAHDYPGLKLVFNDSGSPIKIYRYED